MIINISYWNMKNSLGLWVVSIIQREVCTMHFLYGLRYLSILTSLSLCFSPQIHHIFSRVLSKLSFNFGSIPVLFNLTKSHLSCTSHRGQMDYLTDKFAIQSVCNLNGNVQREGMWALHCQLYDVMQMEIEIEQRHEHRMKALQHIYLRTDTCNFLCITYKGLQELPRFELLLTQTKISLHAYSTHISQMRMRDNRHRGPDMDACIKMCIILSTIFFQREN